MTSYRFFKMAVIDSEIYFRFRFWWWYSLGKMEIYWHTKFRWAISIHGRDKTTSGFGKRTAAIVNFYFWFLFFASFSSSAYHSALAYHISSISNNPWRSYDVISIFSRWRPAAILDLIWTTLDNPRSAIVGLKLVLNFELGRIHKFGDIVIFIFCRFGLKLPIHAHFWGVLGVYFPQLTSPIILTPKMHFPVRKRVVWAIKRENRFSGSTWVRSREKKGQDRTGQDSQKKSQGGNISPICWEAPTVPIKTKICMVGSLPDIITYAKFQVEIFSGYDFTGGQISHFPIDFWMGLTTVQRDCAACDQEEI